MSEHVALRRLDRGGGESIAYRHSPGASPGVVFLGGFFSDMTGTKAAALETHCRAAGRAFVRFDYQGHGESSGRFEEGTIGRWAEDAVSVLDEVAEGPQVLVGSSMGGWLMLLAALARPERVAGLVGVAAAPDFSEDLLWAAFDQEQREALLREGRVYLPSEHGEAPYVITARFIEEARDHLILRDPIPIARPVRLLHGLEDKSVPWKVSLKLANRLETPDVTLTLVKEGDHRLSSSADIERLASVVEEFCRQVSDRS